MTEWDRLPERFRAKQVLAKGPQSGALIADDILIGAPVFVRIVPARWLGDDMGECLLNTQRQLDDAGPGPGVDIPKLELSCAGRVAFISRRYVTGQTFDEWIAGPARHLGEFLDVGVAAVRALSFLHARGIAHCNVKPSNLVVAGETVALVDHGMGRLSSICDYKQHVASDPVTVSPPESSADDMTRLGTLLFAAFERVSAADRPDATAFGQQLHALVRMALGRLAGFESGYNMLAAAVRDLDALAAACRSGTLAGVSIGSDDVRGDLGPAAFAARPAEWQKLTRALELARSEGAQSVLVEGPAGIGKTRLLQEFTRWAEAEHGALTVYVKNEPAAASRPHALLSGLLGALRRYQSDEPGKGTGGLPRVAWADGLAGDGDTPLAGVPRTDEVARKLAATLGEIATAERPIVVIIDDCHFARHEDVLLLRSLAELTPTISRGLVLVFVHRTADGPSWDTAVATEHVIEVASLRPDAVRSILMSMAGRVDHAVVDRIIAWAAGSPLHAQNAIRFFVDNGAVVPGPGGWTSKGPLPVPPTVLTERVRSLPPAPGSIIKVAAIIGFRGRMDILACASGTSAAACRSVVAELARRGLLHEYPDRPFGQGAGEAMMFVFAHDTVRDAALVNDTDVALAKIHHQVARAMIELGHADEFDLAFHLAKSGDLSAAYPHAVAAARTARRRYSLGTAREYYQLALSVRVTRDLLHEMGEVLMLDGCYAEAVSALKESLALCAATDIIEQARISRLLGETHFKAGQLEQAEHCFLRALTVLGESIPRTDLGFGVAACAEVLILWLADRAPRLTADRDVAHRELKAAIFGNLSYCWFFHNSIKVSWAQAREMATVRHCAPDAPERCHAYATHAVLCGAMLGRPRRAARYGKRALAIRARHDDEWGQAHALHLYGAALTMSGQYEAAIGLLSKAVERFDRTADRWEAHTSRWHRTLALYRLGNTEGAREEAENVRRLADAIGDRQAALIAGSLHALACDGDGVDDGQMADPHSDYDVHSAISHVLGRAIGLLGAERLVDASDVLDQAASAIRRRRLLNAYVAPVLPWRATVARWRAETSPPRSIRSKRWAALAVWRSVVAVAASMVYRTEREHATSEIRHAASVLSHAFLSRAAT
jgi:two-component system sensor kinase